MSFLLKCIKSVWFCSLTQSRFGSLVTYVFTGTASKEKHHTPKHQLEKKRLVLAPFLWSLDENYSNKRLHVVPKGFFKKKAHKLGNEALATLIRPVQNKTNKTKGDKMSFADASRGSAGVMPSSASELKSMSDTFRTSSKIHIEYY